MANEAYHSREYYKQMRSMLLNGDPRASICFCIDVSSSMDWYWIEEGGLDDRKRSAARREDGQSVSNFNLSDIRRGYQYYKRIDKLNETLKSLLQDFQQDLDIRNKVAISIVAYSRYGRVVMDFLDCDMIDANSLSVKPELPETCMGDGIRTALAQIDTIEKDFNMVGKDTYTPILIFMTDGSPTDDPTREFDELRKRVENNALHIFPLGIGEDANMNKLAQMYPFGSIPSGFMTDYKMVMPNDFRRIFDRIKSYVKEKGKVIISEESSVQSAPALELDEVDNTQMGETFDFSAFLHSKR